jgi:DNA-binding beta-propeller fold protein YncE
VTLGFQKLRQRHRVIGATALAAAVAAGLATSGAASASTTASPVLQSLTYTATGPGGSLYHPAGVSAAGGKAYVSNTGAEAVNVDFYTQSRTVLIAADDTPVPRFGA